MAHWDSAQGQPKMAKIKQKHPYLWRPPQKTSNPKRKMFFFSMSTRRLAESVDGLNSSLALTAGDLWPKKGAPICWRARSFQTTVMTVGLQWRFLFSPSIIPIFRVDQSSVITTWAVSALRLIATRFCRSSQIILFVCSASCKFSVLHSLKFKLVCEAATQTFDHRNIMQLKRGIVEPWVWRNNDIIESKQVVTYI